MHRFAKYVFLKFYQFITYLMSLLFSLLHESMYDVYKCWHQTPGYDYDSATDDKGLVVGQTVIK